MFNKPEIPFSAEPTHFRLDPLKSEAPFVRERYSWIAEAVLWSERGERSKTV